MLKHICTFRKNPKEAEKLTATQSEVIIYKTQNHFDPSLSQIYRLCRNLLLAQRNDFHELHAYQPTKFMI